MKSIDEDVTDGLYFGFPPCCILKFINEGGTANPRQAVERGVTGGFNPYVPCGIFHFAERWPRVVDEGRLIFGLHGWNYVAYGRVREVPLELRRQRWSAEIGYEDDNEDWDGES